MDGLPPGWKAAWDPSSKDYYYYSTTGEVTWDRPRPEPTVAAEPAAYSSPAAPTPQAAAVHGAGLARSSVHGADRCTPDPSPERDLRTCEASIAPDRVDAVTSATGAGAAGAAENHPIHLATSSWAPRAGDTNCIQLTHGERVRLQKETGGWAYASVVPEEGERPRTGHVPRWALSDEAVGPPERFEPGALCKAARPFEAPSEGYLWTEMGEALIARYQVPPYVWVFAESRWDSRRTGWVPGSTLQPMAAGPPQVPAAAVEDDNASKAVAYPRPLRA